MSNILNTPITKIGFSDFTYRVLKQHFRNIGELVAMTRGELLDIPRCGPAIADEVEERLAALVPPQHLKREPRIEDYDNPLGAPIEVLDFTVRTYNALKRDDINSIGDLIEKTAEYLMDLRNFGQGSLDNVNLKLAALSPPLSLKDEPNSSIS